MSDRPAPAVAGSAPQPLTEVGPGPGRGAPPALAARRRVLVTGATGFLGGALAERLAGDGHHVIGVGRNAIVGARLASCGVEFVARDLADGPVDVPCELVFHCAALTSPWGPRTAFERSNVVATRSALASARRGGARRFVHVSSPAVQFAYRDQRAVPADAPFARPVNDYARTKAAAERLVLEPANEDLAPVVARPRALFGPGDTVVFPRMLAVAAGGRRVPLPRGGRALVDLAYVDNAVDALLLAAEHGRAFEAYQVSNGDPRPIRQLLDLVLAAVGVEARYLSVPAWAAHVIGRSAEVAARLQGREPRVTEYTLGLLTYDMTLDLGTTRDRLGYVPRVSIDEGVERFGTWWRSRS